MMNAKDTQKVELHLQGSQVHLNYRYRNYRDGWKNKIFDRPRSAINNSSFRNKFIENHRRPFSADTKPQSPKFRHFLRHETKSDLNNLDWIHYRKSAKTSSPAKLYLDNLKHLSATPSVCVVPDEISEPGSEDTLVSLGSRIKAKARTKRTKHILYSDLSKKNLYSRKVPNFGGSDKSKNNIKPNISNYEYHSRSTMEEEPHSDDSLNTTDCEQDQPVRHTNRMQTSTNSIDTNYDNVDKYANDINTRPLKDNTLTGRVSFGQQQSHNGLDLRNPEPFAKRNYLNLQQLSLVEEESVLDLDSLSSRGSMKLNSSGRSGDNVTENTSMEPSKTEDQSRKHLNSRQESGTFILETSDFSKLWKINEITAAEDQNKPDSAHQQSAKGIEEQPTSDASKHSSQTSGNTINNHRESESFEKYLSENVNTLFVSPRYTPPETSISPFSYTGVDLTTVMQQDSEAERQLSLECISLKSDTDGQSAENYTKKQCTWNMSCGDIFESNFQVDKNIDKLQVDEHADKLSKERLSHIVHNSEGSYPTYLNNTSTRVIEDYKKEIDAINNLHQLTLKDLKLGSVPPTPTRFTSQAYTTKTPTDASENLLSDVGHLDVCNIPTEELIQNYLNAKEDNGSKKNRPHYKNMPRKKSAGKKLNNSDADVKVSNVIGNNNNLIKARKTCYSAPNLKCIESRAIYRKPLSARIECVQNDKDIESWISTQTITPRVETHLDMKKTVTNSSNPLKDSNPNVENILDSKTNETLVDDERTNQTECDNTNTSNISNNVGTKVKELSENSTVLDIYSMLKEIENYGDKPVNNDRGDPAVRAELGHEEHMAPKDNFQEIFSFLEKVEDSANEALSAVSPSAPITVPKLESLLRLSHTELAQRVITAALQLEERSCCITLLQESLATHKEQTLARVTALEKQSSRNISKVKQDCEEAIKRHQGFIDQLINDKKTLNHRIEQLVDERRVLEEKARRQAHTLEERFKVELRTQHDKMAAAQQLARQRWVKQKAEKIKELTVKGLEGELRDMADRQQREVASMRLLHAEELGRLQAQYEEKLTHVRETLQHDNECALIKERQICSTRLEKQILEIELTYQEQRTRLLSEVRAENEKANELALQRDTQARRDIEKLRVEQEKELGERHAQLEAEMNHQKMQNTEELEKQREKLEEEFAEYKRTVEAEHQVLLKKRIHDVTLQHKQERDREIERAIDNMELEAQKGRKELQEALRRNKEQYSCELREMAETERATLQRHRDAQARARDAEDKCGNLEITISQLESKLRLAEENTLQYQQRLLDVQKLCEAKWRAKHDELRAEADGMRASHEEQMHQLYAKVKVAVARKDTAITALTRDNTKAQEKITLLEQRLQQQRKDFLRQK